jgi:hypothetical protein
MKQLMLLPLLSMGILQANQPAATKNNFSSQASLSYAAGNENNFTIGTQAGEGTTRMSAAVFKAQDFCRAELKDFEFDIHYTVVSAVVYFTGANFKDVVKGAITSSSLQPIKRQMERCAPGSIVIFDEVKVIGPDNKLRTIQGVSLVLY